MNNVWIFMGPSGTGKTTVMNRLRELDPTLQEAISHTNRAPRPGEIPGVTYFYVTTEEFDRMKEAGEFVETVEYVGNGRKYGSSKAELEKKLALGDVIIIAEGNGARQFKENLDNCYVIRFLPPGEDELRRRLVARITETGREPDADEIKEIEGRLMTIEQEISGFDDIIDADLFPVDTIDRAVSVVQWLMQTVPGGRNAQNAQ